MRSTVPDTLPPKIRRALQELGSNIQLARKKRGLTVAMMAERAGIAKSTYLKVEKGAPSVSMGIYVMTLFTLGFAESLASVADPSRDDQGLVLDMDRVPKRIRPKKGPTFL
jgi:transcriptional regulator with XRE-family HTH domain